MASPSVDEYVTRWLARKQGETAAVTHKAYRHATDDFTAFLGDKAAEQLQYVTPAQIAAWRDASSIKATARTSNNKLKIIRVLFQSAWRDGLIADNPAAKVSTLKNTSGTRRPFSLPELKAILRVASPEWHGMILAGLYTGQRLKDIATLTWANVDIGTREIHLETSKTGRFQRIPIAKALLAFIEGLPAGDNPRGPLFPSSYLLGMRPGGTSMLSAQFHELLASAGLVKERATKHRGLGIGRDAARTLSQISFHSLRHTATSLLKAAGVSESVTRDIIGHESAEISRQYTHTEESAKRAAVDMLPDLFKS